jgi:hypothetical protein
MKAAENLYATTIAVLVSAVQKIARSMKLPEGLRLYRGLGGQTDLPKEFYTSDPQGRKGFVEWGFMSTTSDKQVRGEEGRWTEEVGTQAWGRERLGSCCSGGSKSAASEEQVVRCEKKRKRLYRGMCRKFIGRALSSRQRGGGGDMQVMKRARAHSQSSAQISPARSCF